MSVESVSPVPSQEPIEPSQQNTEQTVSASAPGSCPATMEALKKEAPEVYRAMLEGMISQFSGQQNRANERIKKNLKEGNRQ